MTKRAVPLPPVFARRARRIYWVVTKHGAHNDRTMTSIAATMRWIAERPHLEDPAIYFEDLPAWKLAKRQRARKAGK